MQRWIIVVSLLVLVHLVASKSTDKPYRKKALISKSTKTTTKSSKAALDAFRDLPLEDQQFIRDLDKQFQLHGNNIKIKLEKENTTKASKRTIEGDLGYGYFGQTLVPRYQFEQPRYVIYPYSQQDIPAQQFQPAFRSQPTYEKTYVTIQPSQAYEIKETPNGYTSYDSSKQQYQPESANQAYLPPSAHHTAPAAAPAPHSQQLQVQQYVEPVIVLRVPGSTKYVSHLQTLLQQYLEIRAAQYLKALQEAEAVSGYPGAANVYPGAVNAYTGAAPVGTYYTQVPIHQNIIPAAGGPTYVQYTPQTGYQPSAPAAGVSSSPYGYQQIEQLYETPVQYHQQQPVQNAQPPPEKYQIQYTYENSPVSIPAGQLPIVEDNHKQEISYTQNGKSEFSSTGDGYSYKSSYGAPQSSVDTPDVTYGVSPYDGSSTGFDDSSLPITENFPRNTHTKVRFTNTGENDDHSTSYPLPSVTKSPRHAKPSPSSKLEYELLEPANNNNQEESIVSITQRPFSYNAQQSPKGLKRYAQDTKQEEQVEKLNKLITRLREQSQ